VKDGAPQEPSWKPALNADVELRDLPLTPEEGFVASRLDGATDVRALSKVTGFAPERIVAALERLVSLGAVMAAEDEDDEPAGQEEPAGTHRELFESKLRHLAAEERSAKAKTAAEPELSALCFDPLPAVVRSLLGNPKLAPKHARLVAAHHHTSAGLEALATRASLLADGGVRRALLRNPQLPPALFRRLQGGRRVLEQYKLTVSRDVPEQTRRAARDLMRTRFSSAEAEERVEAIVKTEGRCLASLTGIPVDGKTSALLCGRTYTSTLLVQNISRWAAAPPALIAHLLKQEVVRRSPSLKVLLQRHPNAPSERR
jgi:hypothetical protein